MGRITELLKEGSKVSAMRYSLLWVIWMSAFLVLCSGIHILFNTYKGREIAWQGIAILLGAITLFIGAAVTGKYFQKREELKNEN